LVPNRTVGKVVRFRRASRNSVSFRSCGVAVHGIVEVQSERNWSLRDYQLNWFSHKVSLVERGYDV
jgi:hypothetical protein